MSPRHPSAAVEQAVQDLLWLARNDAWMGVAAILAERKRILTEDEPPLVVDGAHGELALRGAVQAAVASYMAREDSNPFDVAPPLAAEAGALCAAEIDALALECAMNTLNSAMIAEQQAMEAGDAERG